MQYKKAGNRVCFYDFKSSEIFNLLKAQINMEIVFCSDASDDSVMVYGINLLKRIVQSNIQKIQIEDSDGKRVVSYEELLNLLNDNIRSYYCKIYIDSQTFNEKRPLLEIIKDIKKEVISGCIYIDYTDGMFSIINKKINNLPNEFYFWEETKSLFIFTDKGPQLFYKSKFNSIEDIICK